MEQTKNDNDDNDDSQISDNNSSLPFVQIAQREGGLEISTEVLSLSNCSSNSDDDFITIDKADLYSNTVSSFSFCSIGLTASIDCFYAMTCHKWNS